MGVREIDRSLEQWQMGVKDWRRRLILAPTPRERERWYAILLLAQGLTAAPVPRQLYLPVGVNQFCRFTSLAWPRCWAALVR